MKILPGIYVMSNKLIVLQCHGKVLGFKVIPTELYFTTNNFTVYDRFCDYEKVTEKTRLVKLVTDSFDSAQWIHKFFKNQHTCYNYVGVTQYWEIYHLVYMELKVKNNGATPRFLYTWFNESLHATKTYQPDPPLQKSFITFDIETVTSEPNRVPTVEALDDKLFSVPIYNAVLDETICGVYTSILGIDTEKFVTRYVYNSSYNPSGHLTDFLKQHGTKNRLYVFDNEIDLLKFTINSILIKKDYIA